MFPGFKVKESLDPGSWSDTPPVAILDIKAVNFGKFSRVKRGRKLLPIYIHREETS